MPTAQLQAAELPQAKACRCGNGYKYDPPITRAWATAEDQFRVTPKEVTRC